MKFQVGDIVRYQCRFAQVTDDCGHDAYWIDDGFRSHYVVLGVEPITFVLRPKAKPPKLIEGDIVHTNDGRVVEVCGTDSGSVFDEAGLYYSPCDLTLLFRPEAK